MHRQEETRTEWWLFSMGWAVGLSPTTPTQADRSPAAPRRFITSRIPLSEWFNSIKPCTWATQHNAETSIIDHDQWGEVGGRWVCKGHLHSQSNIVRKQKVKHGKLSFFVAKKELMKRGREGRKMRQKSSETDTKDDVNWGWWGQKGVRRCIKQ